MQLVWIAPVEQNYCISAGFTTELWVANDKLDEVLVQGLLWNSPAVPNVSRLL